MSQNKKVLNLFGFLMDLLDENTTTTTEQSVEETKKETTEIGEDKLYRLANPNLPPHPVLNPMIETNNPLKDIAPHAVNLINKMDELDKEHGIELMKTRTVKKAVKPLVDEIERLKSEARENALQDKKNEIKEYFSSTGERVGEAFDIVDGKVKLVEVSTELRNNIPINEDESAPISKEMQEYLEKLSKGSEPKAKDMLPQAIKDAMLNAKEIPEPMERPTSTVKSKKVPSKKKPTKRRNNKK